MVRRQKRARRQQQSRWVAIIAMLLVTLIAACGPGAGGLSPSPTASEMPATITPEYSPTPTFTPSNTPTPTETPTLAPTPTYAILRGKVLQRANCRYGPGAAYLYKYGLVPGSNLEIIGRNDLGTWVYVQAIGGSNPCWVNATLMEIKGDVMSLAPTEPILPHTPYYYPPENVSAIRNGNEVTIFWSAVPMTEDKYRGYLIEAWLCQNGQLIFTPERSDNLAIKLIDEPGCAEPSHGRIYTAEKHGYTDWVKIPWPPFETTTPTATSQAEP